MVVKASVAACVNKMYYKKYLNWYFDTHYHKNDNCPAHKFLITFRSDFFIVLKESISVFVNLYVLDHYQLRLIFSFSNKLCFALEKKFWWLFVKCFATNFIPKKRVFSWKNKQNPLQMHLLTEY
jgi:hypothetical protein